jgi:hypothetical protein
MKTKLLLSVVLVAMVLSVNAQNKDENPFKIGIGAVIGLPVGVYSKLESLSWGFDLQGEYAVAPSFAVTLSAGYVDWVKKSGYAVNEASIPFLVGAKFLFTHKIYVSGQVGISIATVPKPSLFGGIPALTFAPGVGYKVSDKFELLLKYHSFANQGYWMSFLGVRAGYTF